MDAALRRAIELGTLLINLTHAGADSAVVYRTRIALMNALDALIAEQGKETR